MNNDCNLGRFHTDQESAQIHTGHSKHALKGQITPREPLDESCMYGWYGRFKSEVRTYVRR